MPWSDVSHTVTLPAPSATVGIEFIEYFDSQGLRLEVLRVNAVGTALGVETGMVCRAINGVKPTDRTHALSLLDGAPPAGKTEHACVMVQRGYAVLGKVLLSLGGMLALTGIMLAFELGYFSTEADPREL